VVCWTTGGVAASVGGTDVTGAVVVDAEGDVDGETIGAAAERSAVGVLMFSKVGRAPEQAATVRMASATPVPTNHDAGRRT
jgi:hypothetical protein